ncbi:hypothetical protein Fmac_011561 [Flemingia macrophylla]|uniref:Dirigent protein n=1 Tax=Flemingia macrophylla TaxID=520843 RepID=A0ABD1MPW2_9FABA
MALALAVLILMSLSGASLSDEAHIELPSQKHHCAENKVSHIHFYYHDIRNEENPSIVQIVETPSKVPNGFGSTFVMDDAMTEGPEMGSKHVGRAQGLFGLASLEDLGMFMLTNFAFTEGEFAGSTLSMVGRNPISEQNREMPIVGGTGAFRFATGYAIANSLDSVSTPQHFVVEYNVTVRHS